MNSRFTGKKHSPETKEKISNLLKGKPTKRRGTNLPEDHKQKISESHKGLPSQFKGRHHSEETKQRISKSKKKLDGVTTSTIILIRTSPRYRSWKQLILIRDNFTCQECNDKKGGNLEVHHIKPFQVLIKEVQEYLPLFPLYDGAMIYNPLWDLGNGITLCQKCHKNIHSKN